MPSVENSASTSVEKTSPIIHVFRSREEMLKIKSTEIGFGQNALAAVLRKNTIELTEPCRNKMCAAPREAHRLNRAA